MQETIRNRRTGPTTALAALAIAALVIPAILAGVQAHGLGAIVPGPSPFTTTAPSFTGDDGDHLAMHFRIANSAGQKTVIAALEDASNDLILYTYIHNDKFYATNGYVGGTSTIDNDVVLNGIGTGWHRLDITIHGATYTVSIDQSATATLDTFINDTDAQLRTNTASIFPGIAGESVSYDRVRMDESSGDAEETFTNALGSHGWTAVDSSGNGVSLAMSSLGDKSRGQLELDSSDLPYDVTYIKADVPDASGTYVAQSSFRPEDVLNPPLGQAVLAGISGAAGAPDVHWSIVMDRALPFVDTWTIWFQTADGGRTQLGDDWFNSAYHSVQVNVDEGAGTIEVRVDEASSVSRFSGLSLGTSTQIAVGDIFYEDLLGSGRGIAQYDDVAVHSEA